MRGSDIVHHMPALVNTWSGMSDCVARQPMSRPTCSFSLSSPGCGVGKDRRKYKGVMPPARRHLCFHHLLTHTFSWQQLFPVSPPKILSMGVDRDGSQFCNTRWKFFYADVRYIS